MKRTNNDAQRYQADHSAFGGMVYASDFSTSCRVRNNVHGSPIARRIAQEQRFDEQCGKNILQRRCGKGGQ